MTLRIYPTPDYPQTTIFEDREAGNSIEFGPNKSTPDGSVYVGTIQYYPNHIKIGTHDGVERVHMSIPADQVEEVIAAIRKAAQK